MGHRGVGIKAFSILLLLVLVSSAQTSGDDITDAGDTFNRVCAAVGTPEFVNMSEWDKGACLGYVKGLMAGVQVANGLDGVKHPAFCIPPQATYNELLLVIRKYISDHPEKDHYGTAVEAVAALRDAFPCKAGK